MTDRAGDDGARSAEYVRYLLSFSRPAEMTPFSPHDPLIETCARIIGLDNVTTEFRDHLVSEIDLCLMANGFDHKRPSELKRLLLRVSKDAACTAKELRKMVEALTVLANAKLNSLLALFQELTGEDRPPIMINKLKELADQLHRLADIAKRHALRLRGRSGPRGYFEFEQLVRGLAAVYKVSTDRDAKVTRKTDGTIAGRFVEFVEAILPKVLELSQTCGRPFPHPGTKSARGGCIYEMTRAGGSKRPAAARSASVADNVENP